MQKFISVTGVLVLAALGLSACEDAGDTAGSMSDYDISQDVYTRAYDSGFNRAADRLGWPTEVQFAWSRLGAGLTCGAGIDRKHAVAALALKFPDISSVTHDLNGLGFHTVQSRKVDGFCTPARMQALESVVAQYQ
ncbi:MAG: hypothetical protein V3V13_07400 [Paracoccaceae bacterium]